MTIRETNLLIERYLNGETTAAEERQLALEVQRDDAPAEWKIIAEMLGELTRDTALYDEIMAKRVTHSNRRKLNIWHWSTAASVALAIGFSYYYALKQTPQEIALSKESPTIEQKAHLYIKEQQSSLPQHQHKETSAPPLLASAESLPQENAPTQEDSSELHQESIEPHQGNSDLHQGNSENTALAQMLLAEITERIIEGEHSEERLNQDLLNEIILISQELPNQPELTL